MERILNPAMDTGNSNWLDVVGAKKMIAGKATALDGAIARGRTLILRLTKRVRDLPERTTALCAVPPSLPADPEGAKAPLPSAWPYYVSEYVPNQRLVLEPNRFYRGARPHHVARIVADLGADRSAAVDQVMSGAAETTVPPRGIVERAAELVKRYGVNKSQFFVVPGAGVRVFHLNTSRPLFGDNPKLRQAVNFAVDRKALAREAGLLAETPTDQYLLPGCPCYREERIYPLKGPNLSRARALAKGHLRSRKAVLYTTTSTIDVAQAQILRQNLKQIGLEVEVKQFPGSLFAELSTPGEPFDIGRVRWFPLLPRLCSACSTGARSESRATRTGPTSTPRSTTDCWTGRRHSPGRRATAPTATSTCCCRGTSRLRFPSRSSTRPRSSPRGSAVSPSTRGSTLPRSA
jgi:ABC-type transport system substrate-binding protein